MYYSGYNDRNGNPVLTDLFSEIPVVADTAERGAGRFSPLTAVPLVVGVACLDVV
jgi:hypothetical protein